jgi:hypothetical protein
MAKKSDFTEQEWESMQKGVTGAGLLVSLSDRSFFDTFKEAGSLGKHMANAKQNSPSELIRELAGTGGTGFSARTPQDELERETLAALQTAKATLAAKAPEDWEPYKQLVVEVAESVANAAGGGEVAESGAIRKVRDAVG